MADDRIRGRVARVLNSREVVINRGSEHGVGEGMQFAVLSDAGENIEDPETGEVLGSVYRSKVNVEVVSVKDKLSIARTFRTFRRNIGGQGFAPLGKAFEAPNWVTETETLKTNERTWEDIDESESFVKTGDPVEQILDDQGESGTHAAEVGEDF